MTYIYYHDASGQLRWRLESADGRIIADSAEGYQNKKDCLHDIELLKQSSGAAVILDPPLSARTTQGRKL